MMATTLNNLSEETRDELASMMLRIAGKKDTRSDLLKLMKKDNPDLVVPELDTATAVQEATGSLEKKFQDFLDSQKKEQFEKSLAEKKNTVQQANGYSADDMKKIEELMMNRQVLNYEDASKLYNMERTPDEPTNYGMSGYGPVDLPSDSELLANPDKFALATAHRLIDEANHAKNQRKF
jgi:hypothetical protein